jgi:hypothetical protein
MSNSTGLGVVSHRITSSHLSWSCQTNEAALAKARFEP